MLNMLSGEEYDVLSFCLVAALSAIIGHSYPVFYGFKGGKGILMAAVCMLATDPAVFLCEFIVFVTVVAISRYISLGSISCCIGYPLFTLLWQAVIAPTFNISYDYIVLHVVITALIGVFCFLRHLPNVKRLINHEENKFKFRKD